MQGSTEKTCVSNVQASSATGGWVLKPSAMTIYSFVGALIVMASSSAATPLYRLYQETMQLTPFWITVVFAVYVVSLLAALLTVGGLSDYVGRKPVILGALLLNAAAMILFSRASGVGDLILARAVQGLCVGTGTTALGAAILDTNRLRGPLLNSITAFVGMTAGALGTALLLTFAPDPLHLVFEILFGLTALMIVLLAVMPESGPRKAGAWTSLRPHLSVPVQSRAILARLTPANVACWALGGLYLSLMPTVIATAMKVSSPWVGGVVVSALMVAGAVAVTSLGNWPARRLAVLGTGSLTIGVAISLIGIQQQHVVTLFGGTMIAGVGFGTTFSGTLRGLLPTAHPDQRAGLLSTFYVQSYLAFSVPAVAAGLSIPLLGLAEVAYIYGAVIMLLAVTSMVALLRSAP
jgi:MFS family permease